MYSNKQNSIKVSLAVGFRYHIFNTFKHHLFIGPSILLDTKQEPKYFYFIFPYVRLNAILVITTKFSIIHFCMYYLPFVVYLSDWHVNHHYNIINTTLYIYICTCITSLLWYLQYYQHIRYLHLYMHYLPFVVSTILSTH